MVRTSGVARSGFTLIELMVALAIVATLLSIVVPRYFGTVDWAREAALRENLYVTRVALDKYFADNGRYPETLDELVNRRYLRDLPVDPITESTATWLLIPPDNPAKGKIYSIRSGASGVSRSGKAYAEW